MIELREIRPDDSESPDHPVDIHSSATSTYIRTNKEPPSDEDRTGGA
jgi:hypothetical protein